jgi:hypothetical protein
MSKAAKALMTVGILLVLLGTFLMGTAVGFNMALKSLSGCEPIACKELGIEAASCEVCEGEWFRVLERSG